MHDQKRTTAEDIIARLKTEREFFVRQRDALRTWMRTKVNGVDTTEAQADRMDHIVGAIDAAIADWEGGSIEGDEDVYYQSRDIAGIT